MLARRTSFPESFFLALLVCSVLSQLTVEAQRRNGRAYKTRINPSWIDSSRFWYRNDHPKGLKEYILVDAEKGSRQTAFDHKRLAKALVDAGQKNAVATKLELSNLDFEANKLFFSSQDKHWECDLKSYTLQPLKSRKTPKSEDDFAMHPDDAPSRSRTTGAESEVIFRNTLDKDVTIYWLDLSGRRQSYGVIKAGKEKSQHTFAGHVWLMQDDKNRTIVAFEARAVPTVAKISSKAPKRRPRRRPSRRRRNIAAREESPDKKWRFLTEGGNVFVRASETDDKIQLSKDGSEANSYQMLQWAPDSTHLTAFRVTPGESKQVHFVESSPRGGGRAKLHTRNYALPGDRFTSYELNIFNVEKRTQSKPEVDPIDFGRPRVRFRDCGKRIVYEKTDRGHQRFRVIEVALENSSVRNLIDEKSETFIWTAHALNLGVRVVTWLEDSDEIIYLSERDGWRQIYLVDTKSGKMKQITKGTFVVRYVDRIDEEKRQIWFRASGKNAGQDPYLMHHYRVNFDGSGFVALTDGNGNHSVQYSPDRTYLIDTYSRVDHPPVHELRKTSDGSLVCSLEAADVSELHIAGWKTPEVFTAKGRDKKTDIWGLIFRPRDFDPSKKYPIIEDIYAGPHNSFVPKSFSTSTRYRSLTELGFVVVKIDGMGTANRSKAFHDVCWHNLKDAGIPDRILWIQAAAKKYPYMDVTRVGIYGTSAGGQNAASAALHYPEFYKAAYAACGCHDNRMDKASWNEQWMGYPVGPHYKESSNIENAHKLKSKLMLLVGEMDTNVPPESTFRFVDALIKADKDFDLIILPGGGHTSGGAYGQRRMRDFFVRHLKPGK